METYPVKPPKKTKPTRRTVSFWLEHEDHVLLERRPDSGLLGGMPGFFSTPWIERSSLPSVLEFEEHAPAAETWRAYDGIAKHTFTHFHLETQLVWARADRRLNIENGFWHPIKDLGHVGLPTVFKKIAVLAKK